MGRGAGQKYPLCSTVLFTDQGAQPMPIKRSNVLLCLLGAFAALLWAGLIGLAFWAPS